MGIYKSEDGREKILELYENQLKKLPVAYQDIEVQTSFGKTHLIETGNLEGKPLLFFHGGNTTTAWNLLHFNFFFKDFHIYAVDTIGHPGKSAEVSLSPNNEDYGKWASEVITLLGYKKMLCVASSFGAGILAKTMCIAPEKIEKAVLMVPSGIKNGPDYKMMGMMVPMIMYTITHREEWFIKCLLPMALSQENITQDTYEASKRSIDYAKIKAGMPSNISPQKIARCKAPTLVMAGEKDCLFPAHLVIPQAKKIIPNCTTYLLKDRGHIHFLSEKEKRMILDFLK